MIEQLLQEQRRYIEYFFSHVDVSKTQEILQKLLHTKGTILFSGVGKSGIIAQKLAMTFLSTGTKALYMPSTDAMHVDLGMLNAEDVFIFLSKSGNTEELVRLLPFVKDKKACTIAFVSNTSSKLYHACDFAAYLPVERELCPFDLAPTTSAEVQLMYGDLLAMAMMMKKNFSLQDFAQNHPAGAIGKRLFVKVEDLMRKEEEVPLCSFGEKLIDLLCRLSEKKSGCLFIADEKRSLLGIFTDGDLRRAIQTYGPKALEKNIEDLMNPHPRWIERHVLASEALGKMEEKKHSPITVMPVIEKGVVVGIIRMHDILQAL